ncbi:MAG: alpha/beta hydrolase [Bacteroidia bacterium]
MNPNRVFRPLIIFFCLNVFWIDSSAQSTCYEFDEELFNQFSITDTVYASNQERFDGSFTDLSVRIWNATENDCQTKPLLLCIHGGGFIAGDPTLMDSVCQAFASRGYLAASIQYRMGWFGEGYCSADTSEAIRAWYRAIEDCQNATFFFKNNSQLFGIDSSLIFLCGWSAGGYTAAGAAFLDQENEKPDACSSIDSIMNATNQTFSRPDLGNLPGFYRDPSYKGIITFSSSMLFPDLLSLGNNEPVLAFNNENDPYLVPVNTSRAWWNIDNCEEFYPISCGWTSEQVNQFQIQELVQQYVYQENTCPHNLHHPCFPHWNEEIELMSNFMQEKMSAITNLNETESLNEHVTKALVCKTMDEVHSVLPNNDSWKLYSSNGKLIFSGFMKPAVLDSGCYYLQIEESKISTLICFIP